MHISLMKVDISVSQFTYHKGSIAYLAEVLLASNSHPYFTSHTDAIMELAPNVGYFVKKNIHAVISAT